MSVLDTRPTTTTTHNGHFAQEPLRTGKAGSSKTWIGKIDKLELNLNNKGQNKTWIGLDLNGRVKGYGDHTDGWINKCKKDHFWFNAIFLKTIRNVIIITYFNKIMWKMSCLGLQSSNKFELLRHGYVPPQEYYIRKIS